jgi:redox-sensitive bicupin YhaK (pirin superfamily)
MIQVRRSDERGHFSEGWLDTHHTFSFGSYYDPDHMGFRGIRVINEDRVAPGTGFGTHPHKNMEIVTYLIDGALAHRDSMANDSVIKSGGVQRMSAGTGVMHSEMNASSTESVHFLQIWLLPEELSTAPSYEEKHFEGAETVRLVVSPDGREGSLSIGADVGLRAGPMAPGDLIRHKLTTGRHAWVQIVSGGVTVNGARLGTGDAAALSDESELQIEALRESELLIFDLA